MQVSRGGGGGSSAPPETKDVIPTKGSTNSIESDGVYHALDPFRFIHERLENAAFSGTAVQYVVGGDSTRENTYNELMAYYGHMFGKIGVTIVDAARSGHTADEWANNTTSPTLAETTALVTSTGIDAVFEFSYGINDWTAQGGDEALTKGVLDNALNALKVALPDIEIVLVTPVYTANAGRNTALSRIYQQLANEHYLPLVNAFDAMEAVWDGSGPNVFYENDTHPNSIGSKRLFHVVADQVLPSSLYSKMTMDNAYRAGTATIAGDIAGTYEVGLWSNGDGTANPNPAWRRLPAISVSPGATYTVTHQGNRTDVQFTDAGDVLVLDTDTVGGVVTAPAGAAFMKITLTNDGANYDLLGDDPTVIGPANYILSLPEINAGLSIRLATEQDSLTSDEADVDPVTVVSDMKTIGNLYELTVDDGLATAGVYLVRSNGIPMQIQAS